MAKELMLSMRPPTTLSCLMRLMQGTGDLLRNWLTT
jgi:hypothetical protein